MLQQSTSFSELRGLITSLCFMCRRQYLLLHLQRFNLPLQHRPVTRKPLQLQLMLTLNLLQSLFLMPLKLRLLLLLKRLLLLTKLRVMLRLKLLLLP